MVVHLQPETPKTATAASSPSTRARWCRPAAAGELPKFEIPSIDVFNLFGGGQKALQPKEKPNDPKKPAVEELPPPLPPVPRDSRPKSREF